MKTIRVGVVGGGVAGSAMALELSRLGYDVTIFEKNSFLNQKKQNHLSFNYTINSRGKNLLQNYGIWESILEKAMPLYGRCIYTNQSQTVQNYSRDHKNILYSIARSDLLMIVNQKLYENKKVSKIDESIVCDCFFNDDNVLLKISGKRGIAYKEFDLIIGADGANSLIRSKFNQYFESSLAKFEWDYVEIPIKNTERTQLGLSDSRIQIWSSQECMGIGIPNSDSSISLLHIFSPYTSKNELKSINHIKDEVKEYVGPLKALESLVPKRFGNMLSVNSKQWHLQDKIVLIGDAAHSIYPFLGQGMNAALQDVELLGALLEKYDISRAFGLFQKIRKPELDILRTKSVSHFHYLKSGSVSLFVNFVRNFDMKLSQITNDLWLEEYSALSNNAEKINRIDKRIKIQKIIKITPIYALLIIFYYIFDRVFTILMNQKVKSKEEI